MSASAGNHRKCAREKCRTSARTPSRAAALPLAHHILITLINIALLLSRAKSLMTILRFSLPRAHISFFFPSAHRHLSQPCGVETLFPNCTFEKSSSTLNTHIQLETSRTNNIMRTFEYILSPAIKLLAIRRRKSNYTQRKKRRCRGMKPR